MEAHMHETAAIESEATERNEDGRGRIGLHISATGETVAVDRAAVGIVHADRAELRNAGAGIVFASNEVRIERAGARDVLVGGPVSITQGGAGRIVTAGNVQIAQGGAGAVVALGRAQIERGGAGIVAAVRATVGRGGVVGLAITPRLEVADGGRVLGGPTVAIAAIGGIALGVFLGRLTRGRR